MPDVDLGRLKRTRVARALKHKVLRRGLTPPVPRLSVVVPVRDAGPYLAECLDSLAGQTHPDVEVVLVDDGSTDGSLDLARKYADGHTGFRLVTQPPTGIGAARNTGVQHATGAYLAFCDADDVVRPAAYERLVDALESSGSDVAIGSVAIQHYGQFKEPAWARRSNTRRRLGVTLEQAPEIMANSILGTRVFRRAFWDAHDLAFPTDVEHADALLMARSMLDTRAIDIVPAVVYHWRWREDLRSSAQRDLVDPRRVAERVDTWCSAGGLLVKEASEEVQQHFFAEILHTSTSGLVRAAVCRHDGYWEALSGRLDRLMSMMPPGTLRHVPVEDRLTACLCARDDRAAAEDFLEYARDNRYGYPHRHVDGHPYLDLPIADLDDELIRVADTDMRYRTRLTAMRWTGPGLLNVEGAAFVEYMGDAVGESKIELVLRERRTGAQVTIATTRPENPRVNDWSERAYEDHRGGAFAADIDIGPLREQVPDARRLHYEVLVRLRIAGLEHVDFLQGRQVNGSAGFLEVSRRGDLEGVPQWKDFRGLALVLRPVAENRRESRPLSPVAVEDFAPRDDVVEVSGTASGEVWLSLRGPRSRTAWVRADSEDGRFRAGLSVLVDEWGLGAQSLPSDAYEVMARLGDGSVVRAHAAASLRRRLPLVLRSGPWNFTPVTNPDGTIFLRVDPVEARSSRPPYAHRRLREEVYDPGRESPLLPAVLFETFAGKTGGDNPGALCQELAHRDHGLDLVFSVVDLSVVVPPGARTVVRGSAEWLELLARARYIVGNASLPYFFRKREDQTFLQTWHGSPLKNIGHSRPTPDFDNWHHRRQLTVATADWDYLVSQSEFCSRALRSAFRYDGRVLEAGYPRNDVLSGPEAETLRRRVRKQLGLGDDERVVLYAPTWRDNMRTGMVFNRVLYLDTAAVVEQVEDSVVLVRGHYNTIRAPSGKGVDDRVIDVTRYPDISHLYLAADVLVTDYSSVFFDFSSTNKPMVFLAPDLEHYRDDMRGFALDYHQTVPGPICDSTEEVIGVLNGPDEYADTRQSFRARLAPWDDGHASRRIIDAVFGCP